MDTKLLCCTERVELRGTDSLSKAISIMTARRLSALPVINERDELIGTIGGNGLLELLLPREVARSAAGSRGSSMGLDY